MMGRLGGLQLLPLLALSACLVRQSSALVKLGKLVPYTPQWQPPVTGWLLSENPKVIPPSQALAWKKIGSKIWTFMSSLDHDFVDAAGNTVPPTLATKRIFGPSVTCGRFTRQFVRMPFHDCGTFDVGDTGSVGDTGKPRFGCNGSLRWEIAPCNINGPQCVNGVEAAIVLATGDFLPENPFTSLINKYGIANVGWGQDTLNPRVENTGFANALAFLYQVKLEAQFDEPLATRLPGITLADVIIYAGFLAVAKCGGPQTEFQPGRPDSPVFDAAERLPSATEPLHHTISYFWTNGLTNFDMVNLLAAHTTACFNVGCLDATPSRFDNAWARLVNSITSAADPRICAFTPTGPPHVSVPICTLPTDAELNARADIRNYFQVLQGQMSIAAAAAVNNPCFYQPGVPRGIYGACDVGVGVGYEFTPFKVLATADGLVNMCSRTSLSLDERSSCPRGAGVIPAFQNVVSTSYFKLNKLYVDAAGVMAGTRFGVARQPCTPGLIEIGFPGAAPNPKCLCCPNPLPQDFALNLEPPAGPAGPVLAVHNART